MKKYILTIDAGTTGLTVILFDDELKIVDKEYSELIFDRQILDSILLAKRKGYKIKIHT